MLEGVKESLVKPALSVGVPQKAISVAIQNLLESQINVVKGNMLPTQVSEQIHGNLQSMHSVFPPPLTSHEEIGRDACNDSSGDHQRDLNGIWGHTDNSGLNITRQYLSDTGFHTQEGDVVSSFDNNDIRSPEEWDFFPTVSGSGLHKDTVLGASGAPEDSCLLMGNGLSSKRMNQLNHSSTT